MSIRKLVFMLLVFLVAAGLTAFGSGLSLSDILRHPDLFDGTDLVVRGEVIGSPMKGDSDQGIWFNIAAGDARLGVFSVDSEAASLISHWGNFGQRGDVIAVAGHFHAQCPQHHTSDIHLAEFVLVEEGFSFENAVSAYKQYAAMTLLVLCLTMALIYFIKTRKQKVSAS